MNLSSTTDVVIQPATPDEAPKIVVFVTRSRAGIFSMIDSASQAQTAKRELAIFQKTYLNHPDGAFLITRAEHRIIATISYVAYDNRFPHLRLDHQRTVEVIRLYIDPAWRRAGLASKLFVALEQAAHNTGMKQLYLHTHPLCQMLSDSGNDRGFYPMCR